VERRRRLAVSPDRARWTGTLFAIVGTLAFSFKAIIIKLAYAWHPVDATTLLALRMLYAAPFFVAMAWWAGRRAAPLAWPDVVRLAWLGFISYYLASLLDFLGLKYITAALERLVLYLCPAIVLVLSLLLYRKPITRRAMAALALSYAGIVLAFWHDLRVVGDAMSLAIGGALVFGSAFCYALYLVGSGAVIARLGSMRTVAWGMLAATLFVLLQFAVMRPLSALDVPPRIHGLAFAMATFSTVVPVWLVAEAIRRIGANTFSLVGSIGPVFTIGLGASILGEPTHAIQLAGAALVVAGVLLASLRPAARGE
jgi:drug/metabolite transporter (DMT)-like permease